MLIGHLFSDVDGEERSANEVLTNEDEDKAGQDA